MSCPNETECFDVTWNIENFSECLFEEDISLGTPIFKTNTADGSSYTWWKLFLETGESSISSLTVKLEKMKGVSVVSRCELSLSSAFGVIKLPLGSSNDSCCRFTIHKSAIFSGKSHLTHPQIPKDVITVNCKIWHEMLKPGQLLFGSILQKGSASIRMSDNLNCILYDQDNLQMSITTYKNKKCETHPSRNNCCWHFKLLVEILPSRPGCHSFVKFKILYNNSTPSDIVAQQGRLTCSTRIWDISYRWLNSTLDFEFIVALEMVGLQEPHSPLMSSPLKNLEDPDLSSNLTALASDQVSVSSKTLSEDLLLLYSEKLLSDATLNTEGKSFSAHKNILSARSTVFRAMFEKDEMSEGRSGMVDIHDIDSETVDRMLVFLYSDSLKDFQWKEASSLYYAADKYAIHTLKEKCSNILKAGLKVENACDALFLADKHSDQELMRCTVDFIRDHQEVFSSSEWYKLEEKNPRLAANILREVFVEKGKN